MKAFWGLRTIRRKASRRDDDSRSPAQRAPYPRKSSSASRRRSLDSPFFFLIHFFFWRQYHSSRPEGGVEKSKLLRKIKTILQRSLRIRSQFNNSHRSSPALDSSSGRDGGGGGLVACYACVCVHPAVGIQMVGEVESVRLETDKSIVARSSVLGPRSRAAGSGEGGAPTFSTLESDCLLRPAPSGARRREGEGRRGEGSGGQGRGGDRRGERPPPSLSHTHTAILACRVPSSTHCILF